jgi:hypothetical protein
MCYFPENQVTDAEDTATLRWCVRWNADTDEGFLFINNHQRRRNMTAHRDVVFTLQVGERVFTLPPMDVPAGFCSVIPINLRAGSSRLLTTNARLLCMQDGLPVLIAPEGQKPVMTFDGDAPTLLVLTEDEALHTWRVGDHLAISDACLLPTEDGLLAISDTAEVSVTFLPGRERKSACTEAVAVAASFTEISRNEDCAVYRIDLGNVPAEKVDDVLLSIDFTGDHADVYLDGELIADWYTTGQPWKLALKRHGYPRTLEVRVFPVVSPTYFEIPMPVGMGLNAICAKPRYALHL